LRTVIRRGTPRPSAVAGVPVELHRPLMELARAQAAAEKARREVTLAASKSRLRWTQLDTIVRKIQYADY
jgi:hypothetical protein